MPEVWCWEDGVNGKGGIREAGYDLFIVTENGNGRFLYRITSTRVVDQSDMRLVESGEATIHLVSCVLPLVYDRRLVVNGELVARE